MCNPQSHSLIEPNISLISDEGARPSWSRQQVVIKARPDMLTASSAARTSRNRHGQLKKSATTSSVTYTTMQQANPRSTSTRLCARSHARRRRGGSDGCRAWIRSSILPAQRGAASILLCRGRLQLTTALLVLVRVACTWPYGSRAHNLDPPRPRPSSSAPSSPGSGVASEATGLRSPV